MSLFTAYLSYLNQYILTYLAIIILGIISYQVGSYIKQHTQQEVRQGKKWIETWINILAIIAPLLIIGYMSNNSHTSWLIFISILFLAIVTLSLYLIKPAFIHGICLGILPTFTIIPLLYFFNNLAEPSITKNWKKNLSATILGILFGIILQYFYLSKGVLVLFY